MFSSSSEQPRETWKTSSFRQQGSFQAPSNFTQGRLSGKPFKAGVRDTFPSATPHHLHRSDHQPPSDWNDLGGPTGNHGIYEGGHLIDGVWSNGAGVATNQQLKSIQSDAYVPDQRFYGLSGVDPDGFTNRAGQGGPFNCDRESFLRHGQELVQDAFSRDFQAVTQMNPCLDNVESNMAVDICHEAPAQHHISHTQQTQHEQPQCTQQQHREQQQQRERYEVDARDRLVAVRDLPVPFQKLFPNFRYFNPVQSECFQEAYGSDMNMVVSAPTGSGKTGVMELALLRLLSEHLQQPQNEGAPAAGGGDGGVSSGGGGVRPLRGTNKAVYVAPLRALVQEKCKDWQARFGAQLGLSVLELSGDSEPEAAELEAADVLCTTPEKLDALSRKLSEQNRNATFLSDIRLVLIDEVHLLHESERGSALEAGVVSRLTIVSGFPELRELAISKLRFVAVSATIPNVQDIATWLRVPPQGLKVYGEEMRPVRLRTQVRSYAPAKNDFLLERRLDTFLPGVIAEASAGKPTLVFCSSRKGTIDSATYLASRAAGGGGSTGSGGGSAAGPTYTYVRNSAHADRLAAAAREVGANKQLQTCLLAGVGFHNAAMETQQREVVERLFLAGDLLVLCSTSTLALGVNLPAHLVVIRGTRRYCGADGGGDEGSSATGYKEYDRSVCLQMVGRAGRPQFDTEGVAVIMTQKETYARYANLLSGSDPVESCLHECFAEHLNAEVVLATVRDMDTATQWLRTTFLYVRVRKAPRAYGLDPPSAAMASDSAFDRWLTGRLVGQAVARLAEIGLVAQDSDTGELRPLEPGRIMAHSYLRLETMRAITQVGLRAGMMALLRVIALAEEFSNIRLRRGEKRVLNDINKRVEGDNAIKYPVPADGPSGAAAGGRAPKPKDRISKATEKIFIMVNEALSDSSTDVMDYSMRQELEGVLRVGQRIAGAMVRYFDFRHALAATANSLCLAKSLRQRMWDDSKQTARQLPDIGRLLAQRLASAGLGRLRQLGTVDPRRIEAVTQKAYPFGNTVRSHLAKLLPPEVQLSLRYLGAAQHPHPHPNQITVEVELVRAEAASGCAGPAVASRRTPAHLLVGLSNNDRLLRHERLYIDTFTSPYKCQVAVNPSPQAPRGEPLHVIACLIMERVCGLDVHASLRLTIKNGSVMVESVDGPPGTAAIATGAAAEATAATAATAAAEPGGRSADLDDAALQPSPFPPRSLGVHPGEGEEEAERNGAAMGMSGHEGSGRGAAQIANLPSQRSTRDRETGGVRIGEGRFLMRPQVLMEAPALAAPTFAMAAAGPPNISALYRQPPMQSQQHQQQPGDKQNQPQPQQQLVQQEQQQAMHQHQQKPVQSPSPPPPTTAQQQANYHPSPSSAPRQILSGTLDQIAKDCSVAPKRVSGAGRAGGSKQAQGLSMSGASLAGAKQVPAFARLLARAEKPALGVRNTDAAASTETRKFKDAFIAMEKSVVKNGAADGFSELYSQHGSIGGICSTVGYGTEPGSAGSSGERRQADEDGPLDGLFNFLLDGDGTGPNLAIGNAAGPGDVVTPAHAHIQADASMVMDNTPMVTSPPSAELVETGTTAAVVVSPPPHPIPDAVPAVSVHAPPHSTAVMPLSSQVMMLHRPGMSSRQVSTASIPQEPAAYSPSACGPQQPRLSQPGASGGYGAPLAPPFGRSQAATLNEHKRRMLSNSRDHGITAGLQLMQQRQARNTANVSNVLGFAAGSRGGINSVGFGAVGGVGARVAAAAILASPAMVISSPASSSLSAMKLASRELKSRNVANSALTVFEQGNAEYDSATVTAAADRPIIGVPDVHLAGHGTSPAVDGWSDSDGDGAQDASGIIAVRESEGRRMPADRDRYQRYLTAPLAPSCHGTSNVGGCPAAAPWAEFVDESDTGASLQESSRHYEAGQGTGAWRAAKTLRLSDGSRTATYEHSDGGADHGRQAGAYGPRCHANVFPPVGTAAAHQQGAQRQDKACASQTVEGHDMLGFEGDDAARDGSVPVAGTAGYELKEREPFAVNRHMQPVPQQGIPISHGPTATALTTSATGIVAVPNHATATGSSVGWKPPGGWVMSVAQQLPSVTAGERPSAAGVSEVVLTNGLEGDIHDTNGGCGARQAANRYSALASLTQGLRKRKVPPVSMSAPQVFTPSLRLSSGQLAGWAAGQRQLSQQQQQQQNEQQAPRMVCQPQRLDGPVGEIAMIDQGNHGTASATCAGWCPPITDVTSDTRHMQGWKGPQGQHGLQPHEPLVTSRTEPVTGPGTVNLDDDDDVNQTQDWINSLLF